MMKNFLVVLLLIALAIFLRLWPIAGGNFPFMYDHAKDSLVIREMGVNYKPALFGAVTSIDGVYNGPAWYYLALPMNLILGFHPWASVLTVVLLAAASVLLAYFYFGFLTAFLYAISFGLIGSQQSAWTPYMTPLVVLPVLVILFDLAKSSGKKREQKVKTRAKKLSKLTSLVKLIGLQQQQSKLIALFFLVSLAFHFQTAFGVVLLPTVLLSLPLLRVEIAWKNWLLMAVAFILPFTPFFIFELRHDFNQSKQIINFIRNYQDQAQFINPNEKGLARITEIATYFYQSFAQAVLPMDEAAVAMLLALVIGWYLVKEGRPFFKKRIQILKKRAQDAKKWSQLLSEPTIFLTFILLSFIAYLFLPCKSYYLVALMPVYIVFLAKAVEKYCQKIIWAVVTIFLIIAVVNVRHSQARYQTMAQQSSDLYSPKAAAVKKVYQLSEGKPFASYHFVPEVYDYTYQFLYLAMIDQGYAQPVEFSYAPGESSYIKQKHLVAQAATPTALAESAAPAKSTTPTALTKLAALTTPTALTKPAALTEPTYIFLIVEDYYSKGVFDAWWQRVAGDLEIVDEYHINQSIKIYRTIQK